MKRIVLAAALAAACAPDGGGAGAPQSAAAGCAARVQTTWSAGDAGSYAVEAVAEGDTCADATAQLQFRDGAGAVVWTGDYAAAQVMTLAGATSAAEMQTRLAEWLDQSNAAVTTAQLPEWLPNAEQPMSGEFPFYPDEGVTRDVYEAARARALPQFCYVQGIESVACLYVEYGAFHRLGAQSFPG